MAEIWCEPDTGDDEPGWLSVERLADRDSVERLELWMQMQGLKGSE